MAISPLALGIGLQGKYDYRQQALLEATREKGKAKAAADAEAAKEKKRAEYRKMVSNITPKGLLPTQAKEIENDVLDAISSLEDNIDNGPEIMRKVHSIKAKQAAFEQDAKMVQGALRSSYFEGDRDSGQLIYSSDNPEDVDALNYIPGTNILYNKATNRYSVGDAQYKNTSIIIDEALAKGGQTYYDLSNEQEVVDINGRKNVVRKIKPEITQMMLNDALTGSNLQSSNNDYYVYLKSKRQQIPDRRTEEGKKVFDEGRDAFLRKQIEDEVNNRLMTLGVNKPGSMNINVNTATPESGSLGAPVETETVISTLSGKPEQQKSAKSLGLLPRFKNFEMTMPVTKTTIDATSGEVFSRGGDKNINATFNGADAYYVARENVQLPGLTYRKGAVVDENDRAKLMRMGKLDVKFVVFGITDKDDEIYDSYDQAGIIPILGQNKTDAALIKQSLKDATTKFNQYKANLKQYQTSSSASTKEIGNAQAPKPKGDVNKDKPKNDVGKIDPNKAASIEKAKKAVGGEPKTFKK